METRVRDGLILTGIGVGAILLMFIVGVPLPLSGATYTGRHGGERPVIIAWVSAALFGLVGILVLFDIWPGWGFDWG